MIEITNDVLNKMMSKAEKKPDKRPKVISVEQAASVFETRRPYGKFYFCQNKKYIAIDNVAGEAETGVFDDLESCVAWLGR